MEEMGGLIRRMPRTALYFLIGAIAISGLPPSERICQRVADLPRPIGGLWRDADIDAHCISNCRRDAGVDRGAGGGVLREGIRNYISGAAAQRKCGARNAKRRFR
jgi:hypothetical protein